MTAERATVYLGELNDGLEADFTDSDVNRLEPYVHIATYQELTTRLNTQLSNHTVIQGDRETGREVIGVSIAPGIGAEYEDHSWYDVTPQNSILTVDVDCQGCPMTVISCKRPTKNRLPQREDFDDILVGVVRDVKKLGRLVHIGMDVNEPAPLDLGARLGLQWWAPYSSSITGFFIPIRYTGVSVFQLKKTQEHAPVVGIVRVPLLGA